MTRVPAADVAAPNREERIGALMDQLRPKVEEALRRFAAVTVPRCTEAAGERLRAQLKEGRMVRPTRPGPGWTAAGEGGPAQGLCGVGRLRRADAGAGGEPGRASYDVHGAAVHPRQKAYAVSGGF